MLSMLTGFDSKDKLVSMLEAASQNHRLSEEFLGATFSHRRVPAKWAYCFLKSQLQGHDFPVSITGWYNLKIESAEYDVRGRTATIKVIPTDDDNWIELALKQEPVRKTYNGRVIVGKRLGLSTKLETIQLLAKDEIVIQF